MAAENQFWGAPRIHGELLKLGIAVSERTVSRYLAHRQRAPSQHWRTFLSNHLGQLSFPSPALSPYAPGVEDLFDTPDVLVRYMPFVCDGLNTSHQCVLVDSFPRVSCRMLMVRDHGLDLVAMRYSGGRDPPTQGRSPPIRCGCVAADGSFPYRAFAERRGKISRLGRKLAKQPTVHFYSRRISRRCRQKATHAWWSAAAPT
jgi:hypothetical protein